MIRTGTLRGSRIASWGTAILLAWLAGAAVAALDWPLNAVMLLAAMSVVGLGLAMLRGLTLAQVFIVGVVLVSSFSGVLRDVVLGPITALGIWSGLCVALAGVVWLVSPKQGWLNTLWPLILFELLGLSSLVWFTVSQTGLQNLLVPAGFILMTLLSASYASTDTRLMPKISNAFAWASWIPVVTYGVSTKVWGLGNKDLVGPRGLALFALVALAWELSLWRYGDRSAFLPSIGILAMIIASLSRLALVVGLAMLPLSRISSRGGLEDWGRVAFHAGLAVAVLFGTISFIPALHERFFEGDLEEVGGVTINVSGRDDSWPFIWSSYLESPLIGKGAGAAEKEIFEVAGTASHPHNEYLRILHDYGLLGLILWLWGMMILFRRTWQAWKRADLEGSADANVHLAAFLSLVALALAMITDNPVAYIQVMAPIGVLVGCSLGLASKPSPTPQTASSHSWTAAR